MIFLTGRQPAKGRVNSGRGAHIRAAEGCCQSIGVSAYLFEKQPFLERSGHNWPVHKSLIKKLP
jgi:hypothetical protein